MARAIETVGVIGLGTMGAGIVEVFARAGVSVAGVEADEAAQERGRGHIERSTGRAVERGRLAVAEQQAIFDRIRFGTAVADVRDADLVIEAIPERFELKQAVFAELDDLCPPETILATNTSSLSVTDLAALTDAPGRVIGMHFFNPAPVMKLVEVVTTVVTDDEVVRQVHGLAGRLGKTAVTVRDRAGFVANALLFGYLNRAVALYDTRYVGRDDLDAAMTLACGLPMGPLTLLDLIGIDTAYEILQTMYAQSGDRLHAPHPLLKQMSTAGLLGRKTGRGFYTYQSPGSGRVIDAPEQAPGGASPERCPSHVVIMGGCSSDRLADAASAAGVAVGRSLERAGEAELILCVADDDAEVAALLADAEKATDSGVVLGVVTSTATATSVTELAAASGRRPQDVVGLHLPGLVDDAPVVEVVRSAFTSDRAAGTAAAFVARLDRRAIVCSDRAGGVVDALLLPYLNDAARMLDVRYATADDIDAAMTLGCGYPAGPIAMLDQIGLDVALRAQQRIYAEAPEPGLKPTPLLQQLVTVGRRGIASGHGFRPHAGQ